MKGKRKRDGGGDDQWAPTAADQSLFMDRSEWKGEAERRTDGWMKREKYLLSRQSNNGKSKKRLMLKVKFFLLCSYFWNFYSRYFSLLFNSVDYFRSPSLLSFYTSYFVLIGTPCYWSFFSQVSSLIWYRVIFTLHLIMFLCHCHDLQWRKTEGSTGHWQAHAKNKETNGRKTDNKTMREEKTLTLTQQKRQNIRYVYLRKKTQQRCRSILCWYSPCFYKL